MIGHLEGRIADQTGREIKDMSLCSKMLTALHMLVTVTLRVREETGVISDNLHMFALPHIIPCISHVQSIFCLGINSMFMPSISTLSLDNRKTQTCCYQSVNITRIKI